MALDPGETFARYTIEERIGLGGLGEVYRAFDTRLQRRVAIKIIRRDRTHDWSSAAARFLREARVAASLQHPNTVAIHDLGEVRGTLFIVMELIRGSTLRSLIADPGISVEVKLEWLAGTARGLAAAHEAGIVHRDVKPANIMITSEGVPKVLDFGLAKAVDEDGEGFNTKVGQLLGTPRYMAPEQREGKEVDERSDQYSFGLTAYELLAKRHPDARAGKPAPLLLVAPSIDPVVAASIDRMMAVDPADRFPSMLQAAAAIESSTRANSSTLSVSHGVDRDDRARPGPVDDASTHTDALPPVADATEEMSTRVRVFDPRAQELARVFRDSFTREPVGPGRYVVELRPTERANHPLVLVPQEPSYAAIVCGTVNAVSGTAELHAFDYVAILHAQRRSSNPFVDRSSYERQVLKRVRALLRAEGITSIVELAAPLELRQAFAAQTLPSAIGPGPALGAGPGPQPLVRKV